MIPAENKEKLEKCQVERKSLQKELVELSGISNPFLLINSAINKSVSAAMMIYRLDRNHQNETKVELCLKHIVRVSECIKELQGLPIYENRELAVMLSKVDWEAHECDNQDESDRIKFIRDEIAKLNQKDGLMLVMEVLKVEALKNKPYWNEIDNPFKTLEEFKNV